MNPFQTLGRVARVAAVCAMACIAGTTLAQDNAARSSTWPQRAVTIVVPYPPGGSLDAIVRPYALALQHLWGQPVVIDNKPGANESIGVQTLLKAPADGYTLLAATDSAMVLNPLLNPNLAYKPQQDFAPITQLVDMPMVFVVPDNSPARSMADFVQLARDASRQQRDLSYGSSGVGGPLHLALAGFVADHQLKMVHVPYKGAAEMLKDVSTGLVDASVSGVASARPLLEAHRLRALAVSSAQRMASLPGVPTLSEAGIADFGASFFIGLVARTGTPLEVVRAVQEAVKKAAADPAGRQRLETAGAINVASSPAEFAAVVTARHAALQARLGKIKIEMR
ncbi:Bug family tripartite tricarboxylate transporter substrate binding protein [Hydrogenophaga sp. BPS33]|uniref:Bug family tripartite tricarboxylate transporter substrate binding protein n=1 Tax=Hydrogenophaga sp. BPS33 TaxID=2651974 RepID=UPI00135C4CB8|nr:tripartite tricarboxylate transporter substrate binding protein [Hydrogenophaga sp. BPS33]